MASFSFVLVLFFCSLALVELSEMFILFSGLGFYCIISQFSILKFFYKQVMYVCYML